MNELRLLVILGLLGLLVAITSRQIKQIGEPKVDLLPSAKLTVYGIHPGLTRVAVERLLGKPSIEKPDSIFSNFSQVKYAATDVFGMPEITYSEDDRVLSVYGSSLEWPGGKLRPKTTKATVDAFFPGGTVMRSPASHPWYPGERYFPERKLILNMQVDGAFSDETFCRAELSVPYLYSARTYWAEVSVGNDTLTQAARLNRYTDRKALSRFEKLGCFYCCTVLKAKPNWPHGEQAEGHCPSCQQNALIGGTATKITASYLQQVHQVFFTTDR